MNTAQLQTLTYGSITVDQDVNFNSLTDINTSSLYVSNGATLSLPNVTSYSIAIGTAGNYWQATGSGSEILLSGLTTLTDEYSGMIVQAISGGEVSMPAVTSIIDSYFGYSASGAGSVINLPVLASITQPNGRYGRLLCRQRWVRSSIRC